MRGTDLTPFEAAALQMLLAGSHPTLVGLRAQLPGLLVTGREFTGVGFFANFQVSAECAPAPTLLKNLRFGDVEAILPGVQHGAGLLVYMENGLLRDLEGYTYDDPWPASIREFELRYTSPTRAEVLEKLR